MYYDKVHILLNIAHTYYQITTKLPIFTPSLDLFLLLFFYHCLIGGIATLVAVNKGYPRFKWLIFGLVGGTLAFFIALFLEKKPKT
jgi:hypothetical protein